MRTALYATLTGILIFGTSCSSLLGTLRRDLDDTPPASNQPTVGGRWAEKGFLSESVPDGANGDRYTVGHSDRSPASDGGNPAASSEGRPGWVNEDQASANQRDVARGAASAEDGDGNSVNFSNTPDLLPQTKRLYKNGNRATRADFVDDSQNEGSLWASDGQTNYYFTKNKIRTMGDIVTINLENDMIRDIGMEVRRTLTDGERASELALAQDRANARAAATVQKDSIATTQAAPAGAPAADAGGTPSTEIMPSDIDVSKSLELKAGDAMMAEIVERYPNGNYKIRGTKRVMYKNGSPRLVNLVGVVRGTDISEDDIVASGKLYEYKIEAVR